jgi:hypothetical protein
VADEPDLYAGRGRTLSGVLTRWLQWVLTWFLVSSGARLAGVTQGRVDGLGVLVEPLTAALEVLVGVG